MIIFHLNVSLQKLYKIGVVIFHFYEESRFIRGEVFLAHKSEIVFFVDKVELGFNAPLLSCARKLDPYVLFLAIIVIVIVGEEKGRVLSVACRYCVKILVAFAFCFVLKPDNLAHRLIGVEGLKHGTV